MKKFAYILLGLFYACSVFAEPLSREDVPEPLKPWVGWVLHGEKDVDCPFAYNDLSKTICIWPSELNLSFQKSREKKRRSSACSGSIESAPHIMAGF